ncbi:MAG: NADH-quinone oxidoreductase subunit C [Desulfobacterales bacterium]|nr:NADH-quinone oxidoreductase subunit C [Desulfobacterales bacterium]
MAEIPVVDIHIFRNTVINAVTEGSRILSLFVCPVDRQMRLFAVLGHGGKSRIYIVSSIIGDAYPSLTPACPQAERFEREIAEQWSIRPEGHPWLKPIRFHHFYGGPADVWKHLPADWIPPGVIDGIKVESDEMHEVAVGPVHAGIIEPGHFRFQCHGEHIYHMEICLGYQHRGIEQALVGGPDQRTIGFMETLAGDTSIGHATAGCQMIEALSADNVSARAYALRGIALELERIANHTGDLGALAGDIGYLPVAAGCGRLRGDFLNLTAEICGNRFGRGLVRPGGVAFDLSHKAVTQIVVRLEKTFKQVQSTVSLLWENPSVLARFEETGKITKKLCLDLGLVGPVARAGGVERDSRFEFPTGVYRMAHIPVATCHTGDVMGRAYVRWLEIQRSTAFIRQQLQNLPIAPIRTKTGQLSPNGIAVSVVEGWRGEICHVALTDGQGRFLHYKVVDPSFHNWMGLQMAMRDEQISDFPICNKSFNLSYCGHDL